MVNGRERAIEWARSLMTLPAFLVVDTETTGLARDDEIISMSIVNHAGQVLLDTLVKPTKPIHPRAMGVHGITQSQLVDAPSFADLYPQVRELLHGQVMVAYNLDFDQRLIDQTHRRYHLETPSLGAGHCAMKWYARYYGQAGQYGHRWQSLTVACKQLGIHVAGAHTATGDCLMTLEIVRRMAAAQ